MTKPTARVLALFEILQSGGTWPVRGLADRLEVDERTVRVRHRSDTAAAATGWCTRTSVRVQASAEQVRARIPSGLAIIEVTSESGWVRIRVHAERLDWIPALLAGLDHPFIVEQPAALRDQIRALARQLEQYAGQTISSTRDTHPESRTHTDRR